MSLTDPPREGWAVMLDDQGREVTPHVPVVLVPDGRGGYVTPAPTAFRMLLREARLVATVRLTDADGAVSDIRVRVEEHP